MIKLEEQNKMFELIGKTLKKNVECLVVGGSAMLFYTFSKTVTKDVDIVLFSDKDREDMAEALEEIGFEEFVSPKKSGEPIRLRFRDRIFDLFSGSVFKIRISENMVKRVKERVEFGSLVVLVASPEDIILSKSMTDRKGDRKDVVDIIKETNVNWDVIIDECEWQSKNNPVVAFGVYLFDFLEELEDEWEVKIPKHAKRKIIDTYKKKIEELSDKRNKS